MLRGPPSWPSGPSLRPKGGPHGRAAEAKAARSNQPRFTGADVRFAGGEACRGWGVFDESRSGVVEPDPVAAEFAPLPPVGPAVPVTMSWGRHDPGAFRVNLPADLPPWFGARFNQAVFGSGAASAELFE